MKTRKSTFPGFRRLAGKEDQRSASSELVLSLQFNDKLEFMFSCLLEARFTEVLLGSTRVSLVVDTENSGLDESVSGRLPGVTERTWINASRNDHVK